MSIEDHAPLAPSSAHRIVMCPGSRKKIAALPQPDETIEAREGTAAHWGLAELLRGQSIAVGQVAANGVTLTEEMVECAELVNDYITARCGVNSHLYAPEHFVRAVLTPNREVERLVKNPVIHPDNYGTPDYVEICPVALYVDDYKHGHKYVEAVGNWQLANYAALKIAELAQQGVVLPPNFRVVLTIHQPRCYHRGGPNRPWTLTVAELQPYIERMRERYALAMTDDAPCFATDPEICDDCPARWDCEAATAAGYSAFEKGYSAVPLRMSSAAMGLELRKLRRAQAQLAAKISGLEEQVAARMKQSGGVPGWRVEFGEGRVKWDESKAPLATIAATASALNINISTLALLTPAQARKKGMPAELVDAWSTRGSGGAKLVEDDSTSAARVFGKGA